MLFSEEYEELIEDIVRDGRLYSFYRHQQVLKASVYRHNIVCYRHNVKVLLRCCAGSIAVECIVGSDRRPGEVLHVRQLDGDAPASLLHRTSSQQSISLFLRSQKLRLNARSSAWIRMRRYYCHHDLGLTSHVRLSSFQHTMKTFVAILVI